MFSRFTPFLTEDSIPKPIFGRFQNPSSASSRGPPDSSEIPYFLNPKFHPESKQVPNFIPRSKSVEQDDNLPPLPYPGNPRALQSLEEEERPFFGEIVNPKRIKIENSLNETRKNPEKKSRISEYGSEIQIPKDKSRPERLFVVKSPELSNISPHHSFENSSNSTRENWKNKFPYPPEMMFSTTINSTKAPNYNVPSLYSPLQGPFPEDSGESSKNRKPTTNSRSLPPSFRNFFPSGLGPFAEKSH